MRLHCITLQAYWGTVLRRQYLWPCDQPSLMIQGWEDKKCKLWPFCVKGRQHYTYLCAPKNLVLRFSVRLALILYIRLLAQIGWIQRDMSSKHPELLASRPYYIFCVLYLFHLKYRRSNTRSPPSVTILSFVWIFRKYDGFERISTKKNEALSSVNLADHWG